MKIVGTKAAEKRRDKRMTARPLDVELDARRYTVEGWSMGGFLIDGYRGDRQPGERLEARLIFADGPPAIDRTVGIGVVRIDSDADGNAQRLAARFVDLDDEAYSMLEGWISGSLRRAAPPR